MQLRGTKAGHNDQVCAFHHALPMLPLRANAQQTCETLFSISRHTSWYLLPSVMGAQRPVAYTRPTPVRPVIILNTRGALLAASKFVYKAQKFDPSALLLRDGTSCSSVIAREP